MIHIRQASKQDLPTILTFIKKLAQYENLEHCVSADLKTLEKWIFEKEKASVLLAFKGDLAVGFALYFYNFSTFLGKCGIYLEDIFVDEEFRNQGIGKAMFYKLASIAQEEGFERLDFCCLKNNTPSLKFYEKINATVMNDWCMLRIEKENLTKLSQKDENGKR